MGGRVSPPYTDDFEFLFFFFVFCFFFLGGGGLTNPLANTIFTFFFLGGGGGRRIQYVITISVFSAAHLTVNHGIYCRSANLISIDTGFNFLSRLNA